MFKEVGYEKAILDGLAEAGEPLRSDLVGPGHHQTMGTRSETVPFYLYGALIAICHQYRRPDGSLGASGKPDPKMIRYDGRKYFCHSQPCPKPECVCNRQPEDWRSVTDVD